MDDVAGVVWAAAAPVFEIASSRFCFNLSIPSRIIVSR